MVVCLQFMGDYWLWHIRPDFTEDFAKGILELFDTTIGINTAKWLAHATERIRLPLKIKGCGLKEAEDRQYMDQTDNNNYHITGRLNIPAIKNLLGEGSFNHPC